MKRRGRKNSLRAGFTLLEMLIAVIVLGTTLVSITMTLNSASGAYEEGQVERELDEQDYRALDAIARELLDAGISQIPVPPTAPLGSESVTYRRATGFDGVNVLWGSFITVRLELDHGELDDGADNNGNGLVDERMVVWIENEGQPDERRRVLTRWVRERMEGELVNGADDNGNGLEDESGLSFELQGNVLILRLSLERIGTRGRVVTRTVQTSVRLRN